MESQLFEKIPSLRIIICRQCKYGVRPAEIQQHLKRQHQYSYQAAYLVANAIQQWEDIEQDSEAIQIPRQLQTPLPIIPCHTGGLLCQRDYPQCQYLACHMDAMRKHWRTTHQWSQQSRRGRVGQREKARGEAELARSFTCVAWQQVFPTRKGSHYIHIQYPDGWQSPPPPPTEQAQQAVDAMVIEWERARTQAAEQATIQADEAADANPWLRMTGWGRYLDGVHPQDLRQLVEAPVEMVEAVEDPQADPIEQGVRVIWDAMDQLARRSQRTVQQCGAGIRMEAARTEAGQTPYKPLQAYMDETSIEKHVQPWQQVLAFITRTQAAQASRDGDEGEDGGGSRSQWLGRLPVYGMTPRQRQKWQALWQLAMPAPGRPEAGAGQIIQDVWSASPGSSRPTAMAMDQEMDDGVEAADAEVEGWQMTPVEQACLEFCIELMNQRHRTHEYESALVCAMAVQGWGETRWRDPSSYPPILSRVIKVARFMVVQKALWLDPHATEIIRMWTGRRQPGSSSPVVWPLTSADDQLVDIHRGDPPIIRSPSGSPSGLGSGYSVGGKLFHDHIQQMVRSFMIRGTHGPMQTLLDWRTYGLKVHYNTTTPGHVGWMGSDELLYKDVHFTMGAFRGFVHGLVGSARELLQEVLCISTPATNTTSNFPPIPWSGLYDDPTQGQQGWCFLQDTRTRWPVDGKLWLMQRLRSEPAMQRQFMRRGQVQAQLVAQYFSRVARFKKKLAVAIHITGGQPARAPELLSIQHVNTPASRHRNIFIEDGLVTAVTAYHKGFHVSNDIKLIHRYMPRAVGELIIWYLWLVLPFTEQLTTWQAAQPASRGFGLGLDGDGDGDGDSQARGPRVGLASPYLWGPDAGTQRAWTPDRFREVLKRETQARLGQALNIPAYRDIAIGISRRFMRRASAFTSDAHDEKEPPAATEFHADHEEGMDTEQWMAHIADLQAAHSSHVAGMVYGRQIMEQAGTTSHRRAMFRRSSVEWHEFLGFSQDDGGEVRPSQPGGHANGPVRVSPAATSLGKRKRVPWQAEAEEHQWERQQQLHTMDMTTAMQQMTNQARMEFRGVQGPAMAAIQQGRSPVVAIMPTGGGKSMLFMLPAWAVPGGTTIVVVPLISIRQDMARRCRQVGISCVVWDRQRPPDEAAIVLVTPESAVTGDFQSFVITVHKMLAGSQEVQPTRSW